MGGDKLSSNEPSNFSTSNNRSLQEGQSKQTNSNSDSIKMDQIPSSSTSSQKQTAALADDSFSGDGDDVGWWDCSLCTYKNSADKFKCEICDLRRGTSTRKPRCNADTIVAQVVKQQEQIRQQTRVRTPKVRSTTATTSSTDLLNRVKTQSKNSNKGRKTREDDDDVDEDDSEDDDDDDETDEDSEANSVSSPKPKKKKISRGGLQKATKKNGIKKKKKKNRAINDQNDNYNDGDMENDDGVDGSSSDESSCTDVTGSSRVDSPVASERSSSNSSHTDYSSSSNSPEPTPISPVPSSQVSENPFKITSLEVNGNLIKYSPPTSSGRTGLIIDKKKFTQHSVTVNDVTITFTEFATRQNRYVRKKKKRRTDGNGGAGGSGGGGSGGSGKTKSNNSNGKSKSTNKSDTKSNSNNASSTASLADS